MDGDSFRERAKEARRQAQHWREQIDLADKLAEQQKQGYLTQAQQEESKAQEYDKQGEQADTAQRQREEDDRKKQLAEEAALLAARRLNDDQAA